MRTMRHFLKNYAGILLVLTVCRLFDSTPPPVLWIPFMAIPGALLGMMVDNLLKRH